MLFRSRDIDNRADIRIVESAPVIEHFMVAGNLVIPEGNRGTLVEAVALGSPSLSLCYGLNRHLNARATRPAFLWRCIQACRDARCHNDGAPKGGSSLANGDSLDIYSDQATL